MFCVTKFRVICHIHQRSTLLTVSSKPRAAVQKEFDHLGLFQAERLPRCSIQHSGVFSKIPGSSTPQPTIFPGRPDPGPSLSTSVVCRRQTVQTTVRTQRPVDERTSCLHPCSSAHHGLPCVVSDRLPQRCRLRWMLFIAQRTKIPRRRLPVLPATTPPPCMDCSTCVHPQETSTRAISQNLLL